MIDEIKKILVEIDEAYYKYHLVPVTKCGLRLADVLGADKQVVELAGLLHDIGRMKFGGDNHEITGLPEAEKILNDLNYPSEIIEKVKQCIATHRGNAKPETVEAAIILNADAMSHLENPFDYFAMYYRKRGYEEALRIMQEKIDKEWNAKLTLPEAQKMMKERYDAVKLILDSSEEYV